VPASGLANVSGLMDDAKRFALVRRHRRPEGACRPGCGSPPAIRDGCGDPQWLRLHRGIPQDRLPLRLGFCQFVTMRADAAKPCSAPSSPAWPRDQPGTTPEANKSHFGLSVWSNCNNRHPDAFVTDQPLSLMMPWTLAASVSIANGLVMTCMSRSIRPLPTAALAS
jgi:hypothetical protein